MRWTSSDSRFILSSQPKSVVRQAFCAFSGGDPKPSLFSNNQVRKPKSKTSKWRTEHRISPQHTWPPKFTRRNRRRENRRVSAFNESRFALTGTSFNFPPRFETASLRYVQRTHLDRCPDSRDYLVNVHGNLRCRSNRNGRHCGDEK